MPRTAGQDDDLVDQELSGGSSDVAMGQAMPSKVPCHYNKGGVCVVHGSKGVRKWKPVRTTLTAADGTKTTRVIRRYYWICEVGPGERGTITWHFKHVAKDESKTLKTSESLENRTSKVGQNQNCVKPGMQEKVVNEN